MAPLQNDKYFLNLNTWIREAIENWIGDHTYRAHIYFKNVVLNLLVHIKIFQI